jgi:uncharacterized protein (TIGR02996 family)
MAKKTTSRNAKKTVKKSKKTPKKAKKTVEKPEVKAAPDAPCIMAIISQKLFSKDCTTAEGKLPEVGDTVPLKQYVSTNKNLDPLSKGGDLYLVTVRPGEELWLVAVLRSPRFSKGKWRASANEVPVTDIGAIKTKLQFTSGKGVSAKKGALGMSLQTPRTLTAEDVDLLEEASGAAPNRPKKTAATKKAAKQESKEEPAPRPKQKAPLLDPSLGLLGQMGIGSEEKAFMDEIAASPDDDAPRLVFADWLEERGDPRAELIRLQCEMPKLEDYKARRALQVRVDELLKENYPRWSRPLRQYVGKLGFRRGMPEHVSGKVAQFMKNAERIFEVPTIRSAKLNTLKPVLDDFVKCSDLSKLTRLSLNSCNIGAARMETLASCPYLEQLIWFDLGNNAIGPRGMKALTAMSLPNLRWLGLDGGRLGLRGAELLAGWPLLEQLTGLGLIGNDFDDASYAALARSPYLQRPIDQGSLRIDWKVHPDNERFAFGDEAIAALAESPLVESWTYLSLRNSQYTTSSTLESLAASPHFRKLESLELGAWVGDDEIRLLADSPLLSQIASLTLTRSNAANAVCEALSRSPHARQLRFLALPARYGGDPPEASQHRGNISEAGLRAMLSSPNLAELESLELINRYLEFAPRVIAEGVPPGLKRLEIASWLALDGAKALAAAASGALSNLELLDVGHVPWNVGMKDEVVQVLQEAFGDRVDVR